jgi:hypothetical protein
MNKQHNEVLLLFFEIIEIIGKNMRKVLHIKSPKPTYEKSVEFFTNYVKK